MIELLAVARQVTHDQGGCHVRYGVDRVDGGIEQLDRKTVQLAPGVNLEAGIVLAARCGDVQIADHRQL